MTSLFLVVFNLVSWVCGTCLSWWCSQRGNCAIHRRRQSVKKSPRTLQSAMLWASRYLLVLECPITSISDMWIQCYHVGAVVRQFLMPKIFLISNSSQNSSASWLTLTRWAPSFSCFSCRAAWRAAWPTRCTLLIIYSKLVYIISNLAPSPRYNQLYVGPNRGVQAEAARIREIRAIPQVICCPLAALACEIWLVNHLCTSCSYSAHRNSAH